LTFRHLMIASLAAGIALSALAAGGSETLPSSAEAVSPILVGTAVPDGPLKTASGADTTLGELLHGQPAVLVFYRGHW
jgi:hypothetical protein